MLRAFESADVDKSGGIDYHEFTRLWQTKGWMQTIVEETGGARAGRLKPRAPPRGAAKGVKYSGAKGVKYSGAKGVKYSGAKRPPARCTREGLPGSAAYHPTGSAQGGGDGRGARGARHQGGARQ